MVTKKEFKEIKSENPNSRIGQRTWEEQKLRNELYEAIMDAKKKGITHPYIEHYKKQLEEKEKLEKEKNEQIAKEEEWEKEKDKREQEISSLEEKKADLSAEIGELIKEKDLGDGSKIYFGENEFSDMQVEFTDTGDVILKCGKEEDTRELLKYSKYLEKIALKRNRESNEYIISEIEEMVNKLLESGNIKSWYKEDIERGLARLKSYVGDLNGLIECISHNFKFPKNYVDFGSLGSTALMIRYFNSTEAEKKDVDKLKTRLNLMSSENVFKMIKEDISNNLGKGITGYYASGINFKDVDIMFYINCIVDGINDFIKETTENSGVNRLIGNEEAVIEDLRNNHVRIEKKKEMFGKKGTIIHIELPAIGEFKGYKFDGFISKEMVKTSSIKADSEYEEASYSAKEISELLGAIYDYKKEYNANKYNNGGASRFELEKIIGVKLPTPIILSDKADEAEKKGIKVWWDKKSKSNRLLYKGGILEFITNSEGYLLLKLPK